jgi:hypothetical protein
MTIKHNMTLWDDTASGDSEPEELYLSEVNWDQQRPPRCDRGCQCGSFFGLQIGIQYVDRAPTQVYIP